MEVSLPLNNNNQQQQEQERNNSPEVKSEDNSEKIAIEKALYGDENKYYNLKQEDYEELRKILFTNDGKCRVCVKPIFDTIKKKNDHFKHHFVMWSRFGAWLRLKASGVEKSGKTHITIISRLKHECQFCQDRWATMRLDSFSNHLHKCIPAAKAQNDFDDQNERQSTFSLRKKVKVEVTPTFDSLAQAGTGMWTEYRKSFAEISEILKIQSQNNLMSAMKQKGNEVLFHSLYQDLQEAVQKGEPITFEKFKKGYEEISVNVLELEDLSQISRCGEKALALNQKALLSNNNTSLMNTNSY